MTFTPTYLICTLMILIALYFCTSFFPLFSFFIHSFIQWVVYMDFFGSFKVFWNSIHSIKLRPQNFPTFHFFFTKTLVMNNFRDEIFCIINAFPTVRNSVILYLSTILLQQIYKTIQPNAELIGFCNKYVTNG